MIFIDVVRRTFESKQSLLEKTEKEKNDVLISISKNIFAKTKEILEQNLIDINNSKSNNLPDYFLDRLILDENKIQNMAESVMNIVSLNCPIYNTDNGIYTKTGLNILKVRVPLGVVGIIYESRPNVTLDSAVLCIKTSNAVILKGGKEAINTNKAIVNVIKESLKDNGFNPDIVSLIESTDRQTTMDIMKLHEYIDVLIPRGSKSLIDAVVKNSTIPVIETGTGNCHIFVDENVDIEMALKIILNSKVSRPSVCNSAESLLIHKKIADIFLPKVYSLLVENKVECFVCQRCKDILKTDVEIATLEHYYIEFLDYKITIKIVDDIYEAVKHINTYSTGHSESIITNNYQNSVYFTRFIDSSTVYVNASTRFTDGSEFGFGAEVGISTQKLHARGPMGIDALTTYKYVVLGNGQIRD